MPYSNRAAMRSRLAALRLETDAAIKSLILLFSPIDKRRRYLAKIDPSTLRLYARWIAGNLRQIRAMEGGVK